MISRLTVRAGSACAIFLATCLLALPAQAIETRSLRQVLAANAASPAAAPIADEALLRRSPLSQVRISPDGASLAFVETEDKTRYLSVLATASGIKRRLLALSGRQDLHWSRDSSVIFLDSGSGLAAVTVASGESVKLAAFDSKLEQQFIAVDMRRPRHALVDSFDRAASAYRLSTINTEGMSEILYEGKSKVMDFLLDDTGKVSFIRTQDPDFSRVVLRRQGERWVEVARCKPLRACSLVAADQRQLTMVAIDKDDRKALVQLDLASKATRVLHADPLGLSDLREAVVSPTSGKSLLAVYDMPARRNIGLTALARQAGADIARRFPDSNVTIGASDSAPLWLLTERGARLSQERYWLYERASRRIKPVLAQESALGEPIAAEQLARKIALHYRASDGAIVHGYLSLPPGKNAATLPMMTLVHGGPWSKVDSDYSVPVQMLVNRGVAVFQPNFRASTGYGDKYMTAPGADFGNGRVQADIIDGVRWLLAQGVGDKRRLGIAGDSFGGYATLLAMAHTPDLFQFGMANVAPTDFVRTMKQAAGAAAFGDEPPFSMSLAAVGLDLENAAAMKIIADAAPVAHVASIRKPLLMIAGGKDKMVDIAGVTDFVARLQTMDKPVTLVVDANEGHNMRNPLMKQAYLHLLQKMVQLYLGGPAVAAAAPELASYLEQTTRVNSALR